MNSLARTWRPLASTALLVFVPLGVVTLVIFNWSGALDFLDTALNDPAAFEGMTGEQFLDEAEPFLWAAGIAVALQSVASLYVYITSHRIVASDIAGDSIPGPEARKHSASRFLTGLIAAVIVFLLIGALLALGLSVWLVPFVIVGTPNAASVLVALVLLVAVAAPSIWLGVSFSMMTSVVSIEPRGPITALRRSFDLVRSRWWPTLGYLLLVGLIGSVAAQLIQILAVPLAVIGDASSGITLASLIGVVFQGLLIAGIAAMYTHWYVDLRARSEDLDTTDLASGGAPREI